MQFSLVIPCYNEARNLPLLIERCKNLCASSGVEVVLVDNGSSDDSPAVLRTLLAGTTGLRSVRVDVNQGYGFGILSGLRAAKGEILGWTHADMQTDPCDALAGLALFERHGNNIFVKGRRYGRPIADVAFTVGMSIFETCLLRRPLWDINAQPTMFSRAFFERLENPPSDFSLDLYVYYQARVMGLPVHRFPVRFGERAHGVSHWNVNWAAKRKFIRRTIDFSLSMRKAGK
ncbi:glycosyl transferase family 2 [Burkholderia ubonensis]|uniref:glycosyltransferase family 2 protein n=1 Tax=Burkholderia TaxID=32008 RepID=UPI0005ACC0BD|nr:MULTISPECIES: glycosyltransferase family 2 protein [Burkholderia]KIP18923.1 glycosyl transferase 2 family protein [Burkholderia sp. MSHR3999]KVD16511.1 glycosyl transferase family 2 [Burkholderia ubonensis]KVD55730.1 glycosyl transferase family 2 [Burkholderia ubonensis]KVU11851.1 glycosyl transferase family 2 [Burkholderia ubonensis]